MFVIKISEVSIMNKDEKNTLSISEFANLTGITRPNLIFYDKEGILRPAARDENNGYRKYHYSQLSSAYLIQVYRQVGLSLPQIRDLFEKQSVEEERHKMSSQIEKIEQQISFLEQQKFNIQVYEHALQKYGNRQNEDRFSVEEMPTEYMDISPNLNIENSGIRTMNDFLMAARANGMQIDCHIGRMFDRKAISKKDFSLPQFVYFLKHRGPHRKKKGLYLVYTTYSDGSDINDIYTGIFKYLSAHKYNINGNIYEDYPLNGLTASVPSKILIRIMVPIRI